MMLLSAILLLGLPVLGAVLAFRGLTSMQAGPGSLALALAE
jgi:hypothetical protein